MLQELFCWHCHSALYVPMRAVSPGERNISILEGDQAMVGNGHSMGIAAEIFENMFRTAEWAFTVNDPMVAIEVANKGMKRLRVRKKLQITVKADFPFSKCLLEGVLKLSPENLTECILRQKEPIA